MGLLQRLPSSKETLYISGKETLDPIHSQHLIEQKSRTGSPYTNSFYISGSLLAFPLTPYLTGFIYLVSMPNATSFIQMAQKILMGSEKR